MPTPHSSSQIPKSAGPSAIKAAYFSLAALLEGNVRNPFARKKNPQGESLRKAGESYGRLDFVAAYKVLKPAHEKVVADMQRVVARNLDFEANKLVKAQHKSLEAAKQTVLKFKAHAQQVIDEFDFLLHDLQIKAPVRVYIEQGEIATDADSFSSEANHVTVSSDKGAVGQSEEERPPIEITSGDQRYRKAPYAPPKVGTLYSVRDKTRGERVIRVTGVSTDGSHVEVKIVDSEKPSNQAIPLALDALIRQAEKGWCCLLLPIANEEQHSARVNLPAEMPVAADAHMRLDSQNFGRCCADIARANIQFDTQLIKDVGDGPFRAGNYEQAFQLIEQCGLGFSSAVASSRRTIADGRRTLNAEKMNLSGKEIQDRNATFVRSEQLIHTAEREFATILEGLRMYLRAQT